MAAATVRAYEDNGSGPTSTSVDSVGGTAPKFGTDDNVQSTATLSIPTATGTNYSYWKNFYLDVTVAASTTTEITNRRISMGSSITAGLGLFFKANTGAYSQGSSTTSSGSNGPATPSGYTAMTTSTQVYDSSNAASTSTGKNGGYAQVILGVDATYAGGPGSTTLPNIVLTYDEY